MSSFEKTLFKLIAKTALTEKALREFSLEQIHFEAKLDFSISHNAPSIRWIVKIGLRLFQFGAIFFYLKPFTRLTPERQVAYFNKWVNTKYYFCYLFIRPLLLFIYANYYSDPDVSAKLGFQEPKHDVRNNFLGPEDDHQWSVRVPHESQRATKTGQYFRFFGPLAPWGRRGTAGQPKDIRNYSDVHKQELEIDICVIGSGAGGAVVAKELAEKGHQVLILEEGKNFSLEQIRKMTTLERNTLLYRDAGLFMTVGVPPILLPTGKGVGGTTLINSGTCFRTPQKVFDRWRREFGLPHSSASMESYFEKVEKILHVEKTPDAVLGNNSALIERGLKKFGYHGEALTRNAPGCKGSGVCIFGCPTGAKQSMERSYLPLAFQAGAKLISNCRVIKLHHQGGRVYKIDAQINEDALTIYPKKVVVACGTLQTPLLLKRSRISRESGQVGRNLTIHPTAKVMGVFDEVVDGHRGVPQAYGMSDYQSEGMMFESVFFPPWLLATSIFHSREKHREIMENYRHIGIFGFLVHDEARGRIIETPGGRPLVFYSLRKKEIETFAKGLQILAKILFAAGAKKVYPTVRTIHEMNSEADIARLNPSKIRRRDLETAAFHPLGSCRMGVDPCTSVVDSDLRVHGMENLWIADGSIFPSSLGVNPQITIMAFATKCADQISSV